jgi:MinD superfamily P-loop ATPase
MAGGRIVAVASGKGGTGKTTVATNLAWTAGQAGLRVAYLDCDVEEPNGAIFLPMDNVSDTPVNVAVPAFYAEACTGCGRCGEVCRFNAIGAMGRTVLVFPELCHGCGGCWLLCPSGAMTESRREVGQVRTGRSGPVQIVSGLMTVGEAMSPPVIRAVRQAVVDAEIEILDVPPGTSCPAVEAVRGCHFVLLVTEPTPFGLHDLTLAVEMVRQLGMPFGVAINRDGVGNEATDAYCREAGIDILARVADDRAVAKAYARGELACRTCPEQATMYRDLLGRLTMSLQAD